jgi:general secretion pathway protein C
VLFESPSRDSFAIRHEGAKGRGSKTFVDWRNRIKTGRIDPVRALFWLLAVLLVFQCVRLFYTLVTPVGPVGKWHSAKPLAAITGAPGFDPFFRTSGGAGPTTAVTSLALKLFGTRVDYASGRGSAIIATPDGVQSSFAVGDDIVPGVKLKEVGGDFVVIDRGGTAEQLFLDQSTPATVASPTNTAPSAATPVAAPVGAQAILDAVSIQPRMSGSEMSGLILTPKGDGAAFKAAGLEPGDILLAVDGKRVDAITDLPALPAGGNGPVLQVERAGRTITVTSNTKAN